MLHFICPQGGGYLPDSSYHHKILSLVPYGLRAVAVFPAYFHHYGYGDFVQYSPSECVVFAENEPQIYPYERQQHRYKRKARNRNVAAAKKRRGYHYTTPPVVYQEFHELLYGFRCVVTVVDHKVCNSSSYECETIKDYEAVYGNKQYMNET